VLGLTARPLLRDVFVFAVPSVFRQAEFELVSLGHGNLPHAEEAWRPLLPTITVMPETGVGLFRLRHGAGLRAGARQIYVRAAAQLVHVP
jgi:hypothetical protein